MTTIESELSIFACFFCRTRVFHKSRTLPKFGSRVYCWRRQWRAKLTCVFVFVCLSVTHFLAFSKNHLSRFLIQEGISKATLSKTHQSTVFSEFPPGIFGFDLRSPLQTLPLARHSWLSPRLIYQKSLSLQYYLVIEKFSHFFSSNFYFNTCRLLQNMANRSFLKYLIISEVSFVVGSMDHGRAGNSWLDLSLNNKPFGTSKTCPSFDVCWFYQEMTRIFSWRESLLLFQSYLYIFCWPYVYLIADFW